MWKGHFWKIYIISPATPACTALGTSWTRKKVVRKGLFRQLNVGLLNSVLGRFGLWSSSLRFAFAFTWSPCCPTTSSKNQLEPSCIPTKLLWTEYHFQPFLYATLTQYRKQKLKHSSKHCKTQISTTTQSYLKISTEICTEKMKLQFCKPSAVCWLPISRWQYVTIFRIWSLWRGYWWRIDILLQRWSGMLVALAMRF